MKYIYAALISVLIVFTNGCSPSGDDEINNSKKLSKKESQKTSIYLPQEPSSSFNEKASKQSINNEFLISSLSPDDLLVSLSAKNASARDIILELADEFDFIVKSNTNYDLKVTFDTQQEVAVESVIRRLLEDNQFAIQYQDVSESRQPKISTLLIGELVDTLDVQYEPLRASVVSSDEIASDLAIDFPFSANAVTIKTYNGADTFVYDDVSQLLLQSPYEEVVDYINQINLDSSGLRILAEIFHESDNPEIRAEVISSLSSSDSFAAKWMTLNALKDTDDKVVLKALEEVSLWLDPATVSYVEGFQNSKNPEIREISIEIIEANSDVSTESFINLSQEERAEAAKKTNEQLYSEQVGRQNLQSKMLQHQKRQLNNQ